MRLMTAPTPEWLSITLYAQRYSTNRKTVYKWLEAGLLETFRVGRCIRVLNQPPMTPTERAPQPPPKLPTVSVGVERRRTRLSRSRIQVAGFVVPDVPGVYVVRYGQSAKVGCSRNLRYRLSALQTALPTRLAVIGYATTPEETAAYRLESELHAACRDDRIRGEWYRLTPEVVATLKPQMTVWDEHSLSDVH